MTSQADSGSWTSAASSPSLLAGDIRFRWTDGTFCPVCENRGLGIGRLCGVPVGPPMAARGPATSEGLAPTRLCGHPGRPDPARHTPPVTSSLPGRPPAHPQCVNRRPDWASHLIGLRLHALVCKVRAAGVLRCQVRARGLPAGPGTREARPRPPLAQALIRPKSNMEQPSTGSEPCCLKAPRKLLEVNGGGLPPEVWPVGCQTKPWPGLHAAAAGLCPQRQQQKNEVLLHEAASTFPANRGPWGHAVTR